MNFYSDKDDFKKGNYNLIGIIFDTPKFKRKNYPTKNLYGIKHWYFDVFITGKTRIEIELVEKSKETCPNFAKSGNNVRGAICILQDVFLWTQSNGLMENEEHSIVIINPTGDSPLDYIKDRIDQLQIDESLSSNGCWRELSDLGKKRMKQVIRLARYFRFYLTDKKINLEPRNELEKAVNNHYKITEEMSYPPRKNKPIIGVATELKESLKISISQKKIITILVNDNIKSSYALKWFEKAVKERLILVFTDYEQEKEAIRIKSTIGVFQLDGAMDFFKRHAYYSDIVTVSYDEFNTSGLTCILRARLQTSNLKLKL